MDFPKSVDGVGLVGGKFVDEDPASAQVGSLIPAEWGNAVTEEILAVIVASGVDPVEGDNDQLLMSLRRLTGSLFLSISGSVVLTDQRGLLLLDANSGAANVTLPPSSAANYGVELTLRRADISNNMLTILTQGGDKIMLDTVANVGGQASTELLFSGDFMRFRSDGAGKWWCVGQSVLPGSIAKGVWVGSSGVSTFTVPPVLRSGRVKAKVTVIGGGGAGGWRATAPHAGGGGGGGVAELLISLAGVASVPVTVGSGGAAPVVENSSGVAGQASSFGGYCSGGGGGGGAAGTGGAALGGGGVGGNINYSLGAGSPALSSSAGSAFGGFGGGVSGAVGSTPVGVNNYGAGGAGRTNPIGPAITSGGNEGLVKVEW